MEERTIGRQLEEIRDTIRREMSRVREDSFRVMMILCTCMLMAVVLCMFLLKLNQIITVRMFKRRIRKDKHYREGIREEDLEEEDFEV